MRPLTFQTVSNVEDPCALPIRGRRAALANVLDELALLRIEPIAPMPTEPDSAAKIAIDGVIGPFWTHHAAFERVDDVVSIEPGGCERALQSGERA
jgi:hypothetical protein